MKHNLEFLKADIQDELKKLEFLKSEFHKIKDQISKEDRQLPYYDRAAIGYYLHNFTNGCESIFTSIAGFFENDLGDRSWHSDLLKRMKLEISGYRPAVIDEKLFQILNDFRAFRHKFRHADAFELDWGKERLVALKFELASELEPSRNLVFLLLPVVIIVREAFEVKFLEILMYFVIPYYYVVGFFKNITCESRKVPFVSRMMLNSYSLPIYNQY